MLFLLLLLFCFEKSYIAQQTWPDYGGGVLKPCIRRQQEGNTRISPFLVQDIRAQRYSLELFMFVLDSCIYLLFS